MLDHVNTGSTVMLFNCIFHTHYLSCENVENTRNVSCQLLESITGMNTHAASTTNENNDLLSDDTYTITGNDANFAITSTICFRTIQTYVAY